MELDIRVNGDTKLTGLIGNPIAHTSSPVLHNSLFNALQINGIYIPMAVPAGYLGDAVRGLRALGLTGFNVTIPYKEEILSYVDHISDEAGWLGAANTIKIENDGLHAYNTDGEGFVRSFEEETGESFLNKYVGILGAGGTAKALAVKIAQKGAAGIGIINRNKTRAIELSDRINELLHENAGRAAYEGVGRRVSGGIMALPAEANTADALSILENSDVIINATPLGMYPDLDADPLPPEYRFKEGQIVYDAIYNPAKTKLLTKARINGCKTVNGAGMLFHQGLMAFEIFMNLSVSDRISANIHTQFLKHLDN